MHEADVAVVGAGPAGLVAACLLAEGGLGVCLVSQAREGDDPRTVALMRPSIRLLKHLRLWPASDAEPLWRLRIVDDVGSPFPAEPVTFDAHELGDEPFGWNLPLAPLIERLERKAEASGVSAIRADAVALSVQAKSVEIDLGSQDKVSAKVLLAADGQASRMRAQAGIAILDWAYDQAAIAASFSHSGPHRDTSLEYHKPHGPLTTVPMPGGRSGLVWMERPGRAESLCAMPAEDFAKELQAALHGDLGRVSDVGPRKLFPMRGLTAVAFAKNRTFLIGEAAHLAPPLGAQGLNLSLRDAATAAELIVEAARGGADPGGAPVLEHYDRARRRDVLPRQGVVDAVNRTLLAEWVLPHELRALGLAVGSALAPLRRRIMQAGMGESDDLPAAMKG
jgi:2-octaprenyl-6-methoxyphenol hydroxylase